MQFEPFQLADAALGAQVNAFGLQQVYEELFEQVAALGQGEAGELHDQPAIVLIHGEPGQPIPLTEDQAAGTARTHETEHVAP